MLTPDQRSVSVVLGQVLGEGLRTAATQQNVFPDFQGGNFGDCAVERTCIKIHKIKVSLEHPRGAIIRDKSLKL